MIYSQAVMRALGARESGGRGAIHDPAKMIGAPVVEKIADPNAHIFESRAELEEALFGAPRRGRARRVATLQRKLHSGLVVLEDRRCCIELLLGENRRLHLRRLPYEVSCPDCEATFRIRLGINYERDRTNGGR